MSLMRSAVSSCLKQIAKLRSCPAGAGVSRRSAKLHTAAINNAFAAAAAAAARPAGFNRQLLPFQATLRLLKKRSFSAAAAATPAPATEAKKEAMFCFQCEQTREGTGCTTVGVCGKTPDVAYEQDLLVHCVKGISMYAAKAAELGAFDRSIDRFMLAAIFSTVTNVNFDADRIIGYIKQAQFYRDQAKNLYLNACRKAGQTPVPFDASSPAEYKVPSLTPENLVEEGKKVGVRAKQAKLGEDYVGIQEMTVYGIKGAAAYCHHASLLGQEDDGVFRDMHRLLAESARTDLTVDQLLERALQVGELNLRVMGLLDHGHTSTFGHPEPTQVPTKPRPGKAILVSGHDLVDLDKLLQQTQGTGINVYTHGEMLPAHSYPKLKKYSHLAGHFGGPWQLQRYEFAQFPGPIVLTSNCLVEPKKSYKHRIFTRHAVGWHDVAHVEGDDFSPIIAKAKECDGFQADNLDVIPEPVTHLSTGFARNTVMSIADKVVGAVKSGAISRFFVIGGCDGSEGERNYFKELAVATPKDSVILTIGCGKYRFNRLELGSIGGIPRVLDMGQCNDAYSAIQVAVALSKAFNVPVTSLPLSFAVSWFEQKAVAVLLTLLHLGIKDIRLGPNLPGFATPNMVKVLVDNYRLKPIGNVQQDLQLMMKGN